MTRWRVRLLAIVCLISFVLSVAIISKAQVEAYSNTCVSSNTLPTVVGTPIVPAAGQQSVVLNEILPSPRSGWNCAYQNTPGSLQNAWIELYNLLDQPLDLYASRTCIDIGISSNAYQYCLALGSVIPPHGFFTFFPYPASASYTSPLASQTLRLLVAYSPVDQVNLPPLPNDVSYARTPDGTGKWQPDTNPTINSSNAIIISTSSTPTRLNGRHNGKSKATTPGRKKYTRSTGTRNSNTTSQTIASTAIDENGQIQNDIGKQAPWHSLQFPSSLASPSITSTAGDIRSNTTSPPIPTENIPQKVLFSLIGVAGLLSLWLGWRHFFKKKQ